MSENTEKTFEETLIESVKYRSLLYDHHHPKNKHALAKATAWKEISEICGEPADRCLSRWKSLRDRYLREWKISQRTNRQPKWIYFNSLKFIHKFLKTVNDPAYRKQSVKIEPSTTSGNIEYDQDPMEQDPVGIIDQGQDIEETMAEGNFSLEYIISPENEFHDSNTQNDSSIIQKDYQRNASFGNKSRNATRTNESVRLEEEEIEFDAINTMRRFRDTIDAYKELATLHSKRSEEENFGILVADMLSTLTFERRARVKAHLMQYLAELHVDQINQRTQQRL